MRILTLDNKCFSLEDLPDQIDDDVRFSVLDNSDPANLLLLHVDQDVGHFGEGGRYGHLTEAAFEYSFLEKALGL